MKRAVFDDRMIETGEEIKVGDMVLVEVTGATQNTLFSRALRKMTI